jgi:DNA processing protein
MLHSKPGGARVNNTDTFPKQTPDQLLGPLNDVEKQNAPEFVWTAGATALLKLGCRVSIVGSRKASPAGLKRAAKLARILAEEGIVVVSGLAEGIDTAAHQAAMAVRHGRTIAVLGTPLNACYPRQNASLQRLIMEEQLAISQFAPGHPILRSNFPRRNRTMALVSDATVIVEAGDVSGSLSQGWEALRLGRRLFIMRSVATTTGLRWPTQMRKYGAEVLSKADDLLDALPANVGGLLTALTF